MKAKGFTHDNVDNKTQEWYTPPEIFEALNLKFDLDPCHPAEKLPWVPVDKTYSKIDDGLSKDWEGLVWLNPPYGRDTSAWLGKMHKHRNGVALVFSRTDCNWFHDYVAKSDSILFVKHRIKFIDGLGVTAKNGAGCGSMLIAWGDEAVKGLDNASKLGVLSKCYT